MCAVKANTPFHFLQNLFHSFISLLRNDSLLLLTTTKLDVFARWFVEGLLNLTHPATLVLFSTTWLYKSPVGWPLCIRAFAVPIQFHCLRTQKIIRPTRKMMLSAWWQVSSFSDAIITSITGPISYVTLIHLSVKTNSPMVLTYHSPWAGISSVIESLLSRAVDTRKLWKQYCLNPVHFPLMTDYSWCP